MVRTIIIPDSLKVTLPIPKEYLGKELEIIAFPVTETMDYTPPVKKVTFTDFGLDTRNYKFDREEANAR